MMPSTPPPGVRKSVSAGERGSADSPTLLELREITKSFPNNVQILGPIDLSVEEGEFVVVIGPSGAGKSTLLRIITGLAFPSTGTVRYPIFLRV